MRERRLAVRCSKVRGNAAERTRRGGVEWQRTKVAFSLLYVGESRGAFEVGLRYERADRQLRQRDRRDRRARRKLGDLGQPR